MKTEKRNMKNETIKNMLCVVMLVFSLISCSGGKNKQAINHGTVIEDLPSEINLNFKNKSGLLILQKQELVPDSLGIIEQISLKLPEISGGLYFRPYTKSNGNRMAPVWFKDVDDLGNYQPQKPEEGDYVNQGAFMLLQKPSGKYLAILPIVSNYAGNTFSVYDTIIHLTLATYGTKPVSAEIPLLAYAESESPYEATHLVWDYAQNAINVMGNVKWRSEKVYPEPFKYLGWCSWEHFRGNISENIINSAIKDIKTSSIPIRWILIDDGYVDHDNGRLKSFGVDRNKFPNGWKTITGQKDEKVRWMGIWRNFNGYMRGISPNHSMEDLKNDIVRVGDSTNVYWMSRHTKESANRFYYTMTDETWENGFDIVKVDFQSDNIKYNTGTENPVLGVHYNNQALEKNCVEKGLYLLNCIAMMNFNLFNQNYSCVIRGGVDYKNTIDKVDFTLVQNFMNSFWIGHIHWIDHDMFHTSFEEASRLMAVSRAISGGPIYMSDDTKNIIDTHLKPLMYDDGRIVGTLTPGVPLPQSLMQNPFFGGKAFNVITPLKNQSAVIMSVSLNRDTTIRSAISVNDYTFASGLLQPYPGKWSVPEGGILLFDVYNHITQVLDHQFSYELTTRDERLFQLSPISSDWSVIGRTDKYLPASTFELISVDKDKIQLKMIEDGDIYVWSKTKTPVSENFEFTKMQNGLWYGTLTNKAPSKEYVIKKGG